MLVDARRIRQIDFAGAIGVHHEDIGIPIDVSLPGDFERFGLEPLAQRLRFVGADNCGECERQCEHRRDDCATRRRKACAKIHEHGLNPEYAVENKSLFRTIGADGHFPLLAIVAKVILTCETIGRKIHF